MSDERHVSVPPSKPRSDPTKLFVGVGPNRQVGPITPVAAAVETIGVKAAPDSTGTKIRIVATRSLSRSRLVERCCRIATSTWTRPTSGIMPPRRERAIGTQTCVSPD